jgi:hypothetical protein
VGCVTEYEFSTDTICVMDGVDNYCLAHCPAGTPTCGEGQVCLPDSEGRGACHPL